MIRTKIGDIYKIPLPNDKKAYAQFLLKDRRQGNLIRVFDYFTHGKEEADIDKIQKASLLFPPHIHLYKSSLKIA
jgi:hypothetical protein